MAVGNRRLMASMGAISLPNHTASESACVGMRPKKALVHGSLSVCEKFFPRAGVLRLCLHAFNAVRIRRSARHRVPVAASLHSCRMTGG